MRRRLRRFVLASLVLVALAAAFAFWPPSGPRSIRHFDPLRMAELETEMWQAYYAKERARLFRLLVVLLHEQYNYSWAKATQAGFHLARAAAAFGDMRQGYERVLPDLERAYEIARDWTGAGFDPAAVARAELAWWVARRTQGESSPEQVGARIAEEYALLYEVSAESVAEAATLRAEAGALRDQGGRNADWVAVRRLLDASFLSLHRAVGDQGP